MRMERVIFAAHLRARADVSSINKALLIVLLLPPRSVIGPLAKAKIWSMVSRLPRSVNKIALCKDSKGKRLVKSRQAERRPNSLLRTYVR